MPATATADSLTFPKIIQPIEEIVTRRIISEIDETGGGAGARPSPSRTIAGPHADDYYRNQSSPPAAHGAHHREQHGNAAHPPSNPDNGPRKGGLGIFLGIMAVLLIVVVGALLAFTDKGKQVTALLLGQPQQEVQAGPREDGPAKYKPAVYSPADDRNIDRREGPRRWSPPPQSRQERLPTPEEISRMVPHYITRTPAKCAPGYKQDDDGWCHIN